VDGKMAMFQYFKRVDGQYPGSKLPDPQGALAQEVPSCATSISAANTKVRSMHPKRVGRHDIHGPSFERRK